MLKTLRGRMDVDLRTTCPVWAGAVGPVAVAEEATLMRDRSGEGVGRTRTHPWWSSGSGGGE